jgi:hypothetical protein
LQKQASPAHPSLLAFEDESLATALIRKLDAASSATISPTFGEETFTDFSTIRVPTKTRDPTLVSAPRFTNWD